MVYVDFCRGESGNLPIFKCKFTLFREVNKIKMIYNCTDFLSFSLASIPSFSGKMAPEARALTRASAVSERKRRRWNIFFFFFPPHFCWRNSAIAALIWEWKTINSETWLQNLWFLFFYKRMGIEFCAEKWKKTWLDP